jgi:transcriptional regulator with XRE-family HTH domain
MKSYDAKAFSRYLKGLVEASELTMRQVSLRAGLDHGAVSRFVRGRHPHRDSCLLLAETLQVDPNQVLVMAGYEPMPVVDRSLIDPADFPPEVKEFAADLATIPADRRREIIAALRVLVKSGLVTA